MMSGQRRPTANGHPAQSQPSSEDEFKRESAPNTKLKPNTPNQKASLSPSRDRGESLSASMEETRDNEEMVTIEYRNRIIELGHSWKEVSSALDQKLPDRRLAASVRLVLMKKLRSRVSAEEEEEAMRQYKQAMYHDS